MDLFLIILLMVACVGLLVTVFVLVQRIERKDRVIAQYERILKDRGTV